MRAKPWEVPDGLWERVEPLLPRRERRFRYPGRKPFDDRLALQGILFVLHTGIGWEHLPQELGFGCGMTAWRRLRAWQQAGVWERLHLLSEGYAATRFSASLHGGQEGLRRDVDMYVSHRGSDQARTFAQTFAHLS